MAQREGHMKSPKSPCPSCVRAAQDDPAAQAYLYVRFGIPPSRNIGKYVHKLLVDRDLMV